jgi:outer membrane protein assembly factor BamA
MDDEDLTVEIQPDFNVDVRETLEQELEKRGLDATISEYEQPMLVATTRMEVEPGTYQSFKIEMREDLVCKQEELDDIIEEKVGELFEMAGVEE